MSQFVLKTTESDVFVISSSDRLLCVFTHVLEEQTPAPPPQTKLVLPNPLAPNPLASPVRSAGPANAAAKKKGPAWGAGKEASLSGSNLPLMQKEKEKEEDKEEKKEAGGTGDKKTGKA